MDKKSMGSFIAALRKSKGWTQKDLAELLHVSDKTVSRWETGDGAPDLALVPVLAELFGVSCDELLRGERDKERAGETARDAGHAMRLVNAACIAATAAALLIFIVVFLLSQAIPYAQRGIVAILCAVFAGAAAAAVVVTAFYVLTSPVDVPGGESGGFRRQLVNRAACAAGVNVVVFFPALCLGIYGDLLVNGAVFGAVFALAAAFLVKFILARRGFFGGNGE